MRPLIALTLTGCGAGIPLDGEWDGGCEDDGGIGYFIEGPMILDASASGDIEGGWSGRFEDEVEGATLTLRGGASTPNVTGRQRGAQFELEFTFALTRWEDLTTLDVDLKGTMTGEVEEGSDAIEGDCVTWLEGDFDGDEAPFELETAFWFRHTDCGDAPNCEEVIAR